MMPVLPNLAARKSLDPNFEGTLVSNIHSLLEYTVWDKLLVGSKDTVQDILTSFEKKFGRRIGKLYYKQITLYDENKHDIYRYNITNIICLFLL